MSPLAAVASQGELELDPHAAEREAEEIAEADLSLLQRLQAACRAVTRDLTNDYCANELAKIWAPHGRDVSGAVLRAALATGNERNYFRVEWAFWFARHSEEVADLLMEAAGRGLPKKPVTEELEDLKNEIRKENPRQAERLIRAAAAPRKARR